MKGLLGFSRERADRDVCLLQESSTPGLGQIFIFCAEDCSAAPWDVSRARPEGITPRPVAPFEAHGVPSTNDTRRQGLMKTDIQSNQFPPSVDSTGRNCQFVSIQREQQIFTNKMEPTQWNRVQNGPNKLKSAQKQRISGWVFTSLPCCRL